MKYILRILLFHIVAVWIASQILPTFAIQGSLNALILAGVTLGLLVLIVKPLLKILFIPATILTFGLLAWLNNVVVLYILTLMVPEVEIREWTFPGLTFSGFLIPAFHLNWLMALIATSFVITGITRALETVSET